MPLPTPAPRRPAKPFRVLASLLYSRFAWAERAEDGTLIADTARYAKALGLRTHALHEALADLKERGYLDLLVWHQGWFRARPTPPVAYPRVVNASTHSPPVLAETIPETLDV